MTEKIALIGAGSSNFGLGTIGNILDSKILAGSQIVLHDTNPTALERVFNIAANHIEENRLPFRVSADLDRRRSSADRSGLRSTGRQSPQCRPDLLPAE